MSNALNKTIGVILSTLNIYRLHYYYYNVNRNSLLLPNNTQTRSDDRTSSICTYSFPRPLSLSLFLFLFPPHVAVSFLCSITKRSRISLVVLGSWGDGIVGDFLCSQGLCLRQHLKRTRVCLCVCVPFWYIVYLN
uniref:Uncharacterized protein n=1 Tax=Anopheles albimanus TaxID=7167 RepID=A0A182FXE7_ANOAL